MIQANELRIGNWVLAKPLFGNNKKVEHLRVASPNEIFRCYNNPKDFHPIPLTPEILEKCGFSMLDKESFILEHKDGIIRLENDGSFGILGNKYELGWASRSNLCKHFHQLQNLYYALTGQELNYQP